MLTHTPPAIARASSRVSDLLETTVDSGNPSCTFLGFCLLYPLFVFSVKQAHPHFSIGHVHMDLVFLILLLSSRRTAHHTRATLSDGSESYNQHNARRKCDTGPRRCTVGDGLGRRALRMWLARLLFVTYSIIPESTGGRQSFTCGLWPCGVGVVADVFGSRKVRELEWSGTVAGRHHLQEPLSTKTYRLSQRRMPLYCSVILTTV